MSSSANLVGSAFEQTVSSVFKTMMETDVFPLSGVPWQPEPDRVTAVIHIAGATWCGAVGLEISSKLARELTGRYLSAPEPHEVDGEVMDVLGEIINMIGGNVKSALCPGARLSMPSVIDGGHYRLRIGAGTLDAREAFQCAGELFWLFRITDRIFAENVQAN